MVQGTPIERNMEKSTIKSDWENLYKSGKQINEWPWSDLIIFISRYINLIKTPTTKVKKKKLIY